MRMSIQTKFLATCILLVLLTTFGISATYFVITKQDAHRESRQRIQIAFDIILDDFTKRVNTYTMRFYEFLDQNIPILAATYSYSTDTTEKGTIQFIFDHFQTVAEELKSFGKIVLADRLMLYGVNKQLLVVYQRQKDGQETIGGYLNSEKEGEKYLPMDDPRVQSEMTFRGNNLALMYTHSPLPDIPFPEGVDAEYRGSIPNTISTMVFTEDGKIGIRVMAPILRREEVIGFIVGDFLYTQDMVESYATLSQTAVNFFAGDTLSVGTLQVQTALSSNSFTSAAFCDDVRSKIREFDIASMVLAKQAYYQGVCALTSGQDVIGAISVSLSQEIEHQKIRKVLTSVIGIAGIGLLLAFGLSVVLSRNTIRGVQDIVSVIAAAAEGDLRRTAMAPTGDEIERLASRLNQMITQLRSISEQVQGAASTVNVTADAILQQMDALIGRMQQQSAAVDNTTTSVGKVQEFVMTVAQNTEELFSASDQVLSSIQQTRSSIEEVTASIGMLTNDLVRISSSVEQVNHSVKHVSESTGELLSIAQHTESEAHQIDRSFNEILSNASQSQQLAGETMNAVTRGQASVDASIQGMGELKAVVANTAQIIQEMNSWSEQVSSILGIVDEITEQTSLLALNASIISAQAGVHGRGFAVVADEIKNLATRTKASTKEISTLIHELQGKTEEGVQQTFEGIHKAEQGMERANAVREDLTTILDSATRSSSRAGDTLRVVQQTVESSQSIQISMKNVTEMVANIREAIQQEEHDIQEVGLAVENISGMSEEVRRASVEQKKAAIQITESMGYVSVQFNEVAEQTNTLKEHTQQIAAAIQSIEGATEDTLDNATHIAGETVKNLLRESDVLQKIVNVFKVK